MVKFKNPSLIKAVFFALFLTSLFFIIKPVWYSYYPDFTSYYSGTKTIVSGENPYTIDDRVVGSFIYPPSTIFIFLPFILLPLKIAGNIFSVFSVFCFSVSVIILFKLFKVKPFSYTFLLLSVLIFNFFPEKFTLGMGQINNVVFLALVLFIYFFIKRKKVLAGIFLSASILLKIFPIIIFLFLILTKEWKTLFASIISIIFVLLFSFLFFEHAAFFIFFTKVFPFLLNLTPGEYYNQSLSGFLARIVGNTTLQLVIKTGVSLVLTVIAALVFRKNKSISSFRYLLCFGLLIVLSLVISGVSWQHHFVYAIIPLMVVFFYIKRKRLNIKYYSVLGLSYLSIAVNMRNPAIFPVFLRSHTLYGALILYFFILHLILKKDPEKGLSF